MSLAFFFRIAHDGLSERGTAPRLHQQSKTVQQDTLTERKDALRSFLRLTRPACELKQ